jgi:hypothetical protein
MYVECKEVSRVPMLDPSCVLADYYWTLQREFFKSYYLLTNK